MNRLLKAGTWIAAASSVALFSHYRDPSHSSKLSRFMTTAANAAPAVHVPTESAQYRFLVIGKTGNGKSTAGNILQGTDAFETGRSMASKTLQAQSSSAVRNGDQILVVDTPDPVNWEGPNKPDLLQEVQRWKTMVAPHPSANLLAVRCDVRYTAEEFDVYKRIKAAWGDRSFTRRLVVAFTFGDRQDRPIEQELRDVCPELKSVLRDANGRYVLFNGQTDNTDEQLAQLQEFVRQMDREPAVPDYYPEMQRQMDREPAVPDWYPKMQIGLAVVSVVSGLLFAAFLTARLTGPTAAFGALCFVFAVGLIVSEVCSPRIVRAIDNRRKNG